MFYEVLLNWGGPRLDNLVAININGPEIHSVYRWRNQHKVTLTCGLDEGTEDETAIVPEIHYN